jgi:mannose-6-phosphate isomerase-like protein (cupin superfamily)
MSKLSYATTEKNVKIIHRNAIPALKSIEIGNNVHNLGLLLDFRKNRDLAAFLPEQGRFSLSWVRLKKEETLSAHAHPTVSMIIITEGEGVTMGDIQQPIAAGDIVIVSPHSKHGFTGKGKEGFWALSIQFEGLGLYEDPTRARVKFAQNGALTDPISLLEKDQVKHEERFRKGALMEADQFRVRPAKRSERQVTGSSQFLVRLVSKNPCRPCSRRKSQGVSGTGRATFCRRGRA